MSVAFVDAPLLAPLHAPDTNRGHQPLHRAPGHWRQLHRHPPHLHGVGLVSALGELDRRAHGPHRPAVTVADDRAGRPADLVERRFVAGRPNQLWLADIERHEALPNRAVMKGHGHRPVAAGRLKLRAA